MDETVKITAYSSGKIVSSREISLYDYYDGDDIPEIDTPEFIAGNSVDIVEIVKYDFDDECYYIDKNYYNSEGRVVRFETYDTEGNLKKSETVEDLLKDGGNYV